MKSLSRRFFMRALGAVPGAAAALELQAKAAAHGVPLLPPDSLNNPTPPSATAPTRFIDFKDWWQKCGRDNAESRARHVTHFDADILAMASIALHAKVRMQRARNLESLKAEQEKDFLSRVARDGFFQWWA